MSLGLGSAGIDLPPNVDRVLSEFVQSVQAALESDLRSIVLYGSAAEGRLRPTSDVNVIVVLSAFEPARVDALREPMRTAHAAIRLGVMFLLESEVDAAVEAFSVKFADILRRHQVLVGTDPFANVSLSRSAQIARLRQVVLNLSLRMRQQYLLRSLREEQAAIVVADAAGPLRSCAAALLDLEGHPASSPKEALETIAARLPGSDWDEVLTRMSEARETRALGPGIAAPTILRLIGLAGQLRTQVDGLG